MSKLSEHRLEQIKIIENLEQKILSNKANIELLDSTNYDKDKRLSLGLLHLLSPGLKNKIFDQVTLDLKKELPNIYYTRRDSLHMTIKNVRTVAYPPTFNARDIEVVKNVFDKVLYKQTAFQAYFHKILVFPLSLSLVFTTDETFDELVINSQDMLQDNNIGDDKKYDNSKYFFINITVARFDNKYFEKISKIVEKYNNFKVEDYKIRKASLVTSNVSCTNRVIHKTWILR